MAFVVKEVTIDEWLAEMGDKSAVNVAVTLEATSGATANLLKGVGNDHRICIVVPYSNGNVASIMRDVKKKIDDRKKWRQEEMELFNKLYGARVDD